MNNLKMVTKMIAKTKRKLKRTERARMTNLKFRKNMIANLNMKTVIQKMIQQALTHMEIGPMDIVLKQ